MMLDLPPNALIGIIAGPLLVFILATAGWFARRAFAQTDKEVARIDKEIDKMAITQKEYEKSLLNVLLAQNRFDLRLEAGFERIGDDMDNVKSSITGLQSNIDRMGTDMDSMKTNIAGLQSDLRDHRAAVDKEIAVIRERISRNGSP